MPMPQSLGNPDVPPLLRLTRLALAHLGLAGLTLACLGLAFWTGEADAVPDIRYDYVIIVGNNDLLNAVEPLRQWKEELGYSVWVTTVDDIHSSYQTGDLALDIWSFLRDRYAPSAWGIRYVLLVGDIDTIPMRMLYPDGQPDDGLGYGSDYYYCLPSNSNWDHDGDKRWGEFGQDDLPREPDVLVGRVPLDDPNDVTDYVNNLITYEQNTGGWKRDVLLPAGFLDYRTPGSPYNTDGAVTANKVENEILQPNAWTATTLYEKGGIAPSAIPSDDTLDATTFQFQCGPSAHGVVTSLAHGNQNSMKGWQWSHDFDNDGWWDPGPPVTELVPNTFLISTQIPTLPPFSLVFLCGCQTGLLFGKEPAFAESGLRSEYLISTTVSPLSVKRYLRRSAPAVIASTAGSDYRSGWDSLDDGSEQTLDYLFMEELVKNDRAGGDAFFKAMTRYVDMPGLGFQRGVRVFQYFGDPSLNIKGFSSRPGGPDVTIHEGFYYDYGVDSDDNGDMYVAVLTTPDDQVGSVSVYRSVDHGQSWELWTTIDHEAALLAVDALVGRWGLESADSRLLVFLGDENGDVWVERINLSDPNDRDRQPVYTEHTGLKIGDLEVTRDPGAMPSAFHTYVVWEEGVIGADQVHVAHSPDNGMTWDGDFVFADHQMPDIEATVDGKVFLVTDYVFGPDHVDVCNSTDHGQSWSGYTNLTNGDGADPEDAHYNPTIGASTHPSVPAIWIAYELDHTPQGDDPETRELRYAYGTDGGGSWERNRILTAASGSYEIRPDLASYRSSPNYYINVVANHLGEAALDGEPQVRWRYASGTSPTYWSAQRIVNDYRPTTLDARAVYSPGAAGTGSGVVYGGSTRENLYFSAPWLTGARPFPDPIRIDGDLAAGLGHGLDGDPAAQPAHHSGGVIAPDPGGGHARDAGSAAPGAGLGPSMAPIPLNLEDTPPLIWLETADLPELNYVADIVLDETGLIACGGAAGTAGRVLRSTDQGETWMQLGELPDALDLSFVQRLADGSLWSGGFGMPGGEPTGLLYRSDDEGASWETMLAVPDAVVTTLLQTASGDLFAGTGWNGDLYVSDDGGLSWVVAATLGLGATVHDLAQIPSGLLIAACEGEAVPAVQISTDGYDWNEVAGLADLDVAFDIEVNGDECFAAGRGTAGAVVLRADDASATTWSPVSPLLDEDLMAARALGIGPSGELLAGGERPFGSSTTPVYSSTDGGATWRRFGGSIDSANTVHAFSVVGGLVYAATGDLDGNVYVCSGQHAAGLPPVAPPVDLDPSGRLALRARPNPFQGSIEIDLRTAPSKPVSIELFDPTGRLVRRLESASPGDGDTRTLTWDGRDESGRPVAAGVYTLRGTSGGRTESRSIVRIR
jgi:hypothetical protein